MITSVNILIISFAVSSSIIWLVAIIPPKALVVSHENAFKYASLNELELATPQGFACLMIATVGTL